MRVNGPLFISLLLSVALSPAVLFAQDGTADLVGGGIGLVIGLLIVVVIGAVVGWLATLIVSGSGGSFWGDVLVGIGGALIARFLFPALGIGFGSGIVGAILPALIGAVILLLVLKLIRRAS
jgi:uncharacterized membrane protein YeaQ/YmgE (transglycosylase-associated protein family)